MRISKVAKEIHGSSYGNGSSWFCSSSTYKRMLAQQGKIQESKC